MKLRSSLDPEEIPSEWLIERMTNQRNLLLAASDWAMTPDAPTDKTAWAKYRQDLRDFPTTWEPNEIANFPEIPE